MNTTNTTDTKIKKPIYKKWWFWVLVVLIIGAGASGNSNSSKDQATTPSTNTPAANEAAAKETETPEPAEEEKATTFSDGTYKVGTDMPAGEYKVHLTSSMGYTEISSGCRGTFDEIIANDALTGDSYITVKDGQYLKLQGVEIQK